MLRVADLFCGAGGTSTGLLRACEQLGKPVDLVAVNHWDLAIETHSRNHPEVRHFCATIDSLSPTKAVPSGRLDLLVASPECTHHSKAKGDKPVDDQKRAGAHQILDWVAALWPEEVLVENVPCFAEWGPLNEKKRPIKALKGTFFRNWLRSLEGLGYQVSCRKLNCADYGDPTSRPRLFIRASRNGPVRWPEPSHGKGCPQPWKTARDVVDLSNLGKSIFNRKIPLVPKTMARIEYGIKTFCSRDMVEPFLMLYYGQSKVRSLDEPVPTITADGQHIALIQPFILPHRHGGKSGPMVDSIDQPIRTLTASNADDTYLVSPAVFEHGGMDIFHRMLTEEELAVAQGFPKSYTFAGRLKEDRIRQIGNAVPTYTAEALCLSALASIDRGRKQAA